MKDYFDIGKIVNTQGIKGDVRIFPTTDDITRFELLDFVSVVIGKDVLNLNINKVWYHKQFVVVKFEGIDDMTAAEKLKGGVIKIPPEKAIPLENDEYFVRDLIGVSAFLENGDEVGEIVDILFTGANDVYVIKQSDGKEILLPAIKQCILNVDIKSKKMVVNILEGLIE